MSYQRCDNLLSVFGTLIAQNVGTLDDLEVVLGTHRKKSFELVFTADERRCLSESMKRL